MIIPSRTRNRNFLPNFNLIFCCAGVCADSVTPVAIKNLFSQYVSRHDVYEHQRNQHQRKKPLEPIDHCLFPSYRASRSIPLS